MKNALKGILFSFMFTALLAPAVAFAGGGPVIIKSLPATISVPGNYTLAKSLKYTDNLTNAITISAPDVTLEMNGFGIAGPGKATASYVGINITANRVEVRNGYVTGFGLGINSEGKTQKIINVKSYLNGEEGVRTAGDNVLVKDCVVEDNDRDGIYVSGTGCIVIGNMVSGNTWNGISVTGSGCNINGDTAHNNGYDGIVGGYDSVILNNTAYANGRDGIDATAPSLVNGNASYSNNSTSSSFVNIKTSGTTVEGSNLK